jgi:hypothetical protein
MAGVPGYTFSEIGDWPLHQPVLSRVVLVVPGLVGLLVCCDGDVDLVILPFFCCCRRRSCEGTGFRLFLSVIRTSFRVAVIFEIADLWSLGEFLDVSVVFLVGFVKRMFLIISWASWVSGSGVSLVVVIHLRLHGSCPAVSSLSICWMLSGVSRTTGGYCLVGDVCSFIDAAGGVVCNSVSVRVVSSSWVNGSSLVIFVRALVIC